MRYLFIVWALLAVVGIVSDAQAASVIDQVKARGVVRCGSAERPGLAFVGAKGRWQGLNVDICRAVATAVLGSPERIEFHDYETPKDFRAVGEHKDDLYFLTATEVADHDLAGKVVPGPTVFVNSDAVMVASRSTARHVSDLAGDSICFMIGSSSERSLNAYFDALHKSVDRRPFSEEGEMVDTYNVQRCHAVADEITTLAQMRLDRGINRIASRILPEPLTVFPVMAMTGTDDARWSALVAWTVHTLIGAERPETRWYAGGVRAMPVSAPELGLDRNWQQRVVGAVGNYGDIFERNLGSGSRLRLDRGLNANQVNGGLLLSPFIE